MTDPLPPTDDSTPDAAIEVIRSEERLRTEVRTRPIAVATLMKRIVTEQRTITVEVRHEEAQLTVRPVDAETPNTHAAHAALPEITLYEEQIVITRRLVPTERVRLQITPVTVEQPVTADLRHEAITITDPEQPAATGDTTPTSPDQEAARP